MLLLATIFSAGCRPRWLTLLQIGTCAVLALATCPILETPFVRWNTGVMIALARNLGSGDRARISYSNVGTEIHNGDARGADFSLEPVFAWLTSYVVEHEVLTGQVIGGSRMYSGRHLDGGTETAGTPRRQPNLRAV